MLKVTMVKRSKLFLSTGLVVLSGAYVWWERAAENQTPVSHAPSLARTVPPGKAAKPDSSITDDQQLAKMKLKRDLAVKPPAGGNTDTRTSIRDRAAIVRSPSIKVESNKPHTVAPAALSALSPDLPAQVSLDGLTGRYLEGEFLGDEVNGEWGPVQVKVTVKQGSIADVICTEYPNHRRRSESISEWSIPMLVTETIKAQDAHIDWITQASFTSDQYQKSLASALKRAKNPAN